MALSEVMLLPPTELHSPSSRLWGAEIWGMGGMGKLGVKLGNGVKIGNGGMEMGSLWRMGLKWGNGESSKKK